SSLSTLSIGSVTRAHHPLHIPRNFRSAAADSSRMSSKGPSRPETASRNTAAPPWPDRQVPATINTSVASLSPDAAPAVRRVLTEVHRDRQIRHVQSFGYSVAALPITVRTAGNRLGELASDQTG